MAENIVELADDAVALGDIDGELRALWQQIQAREGLPVCHSLTANLIAVTDPEREALLRDELDRLVVRHRCRLFLLVRDVGAAPLAVRLTARCKRHRGACESILELIRLQCGERAFAQVPGLIRARLVVDVPTHLYWAAPLPADTWQLATLARVADRLIVASGLFADPGADLARLREACGEDWVDLVAFRTRPWRRALAEAFEYFPWQPQVGARVTMCHGSAPAAVAAVHTLARWLQDRLGAAVYLEAAAGDLAPIGEPASLELAHGDVTVRIERMPAGLHLLARVRRGAHELTSFDVFASRGVDGDLLAAAVDAW